MYSDGMQFTTSDNDQDLSSVNCADYFGDGGGWWFNACFRANLNGVYANGRTQLAAGHGIIWEEWYVEYTLKAVEMKMKPATA
jgi:ficolin